MFLRNNILTYFLLVLCIFCLKWNETYAQEQDKPAPAVKTDSFSISEIAKQRLSKLAKGEVKLDQEKESQNVTQAQNGFTDPMMPAGPNPLLLDSLTNQKYLESLRQYYDYHIKGLEHRKRVFKWQLFSSKIIFVVVIILVFAGIYFAAVQFHLGVRQAKTNAADLTERTEITASLKGIKVSSPVLGVIILVISLAFFYLYLIYVFPIEDIF